MSTWDYEIISLTYLRQFRKSCAICLSLYIISSPGLNFKCMRDGGPQDIYLSWQALFQY